MSNEFGDSLIEISDKFSEKNNIFFYKIILF